MVSQYHCIDLFVRVPPCLLSEVCRRGGGGGGTPRGVPVGLSENSGGRGRGVRWGVVESGGVSDMSGPHYPPSIATAAKQTNRQTN